MENEKWKLCIDYKLINNNNKKKKKKKKKKKDWYVVPKIQEIFDALKDEKKNIFLNRFI